MYVNLSVAKNLKVKYNFYIYIQCFVWFVAYIEYLKEHLRTFSYWKYSTFQEIKFSSVQKLLRRRIFSLSDICLKYETKTEVQHKPIISCNVIWIKVEVASLQGYCFSIDFRHVWDIGNILFARLLTYCIQWSTYLFIRSSPRFFLHWNSIKDNESLKHKDSQAIEWFNLRNSVWKYMCVNIAIQIIVADDSNVWLWGLLTVLLCPGRFGKCM